MNATDIVGYVYAADTYCPDCTAGIFRPDDGFERTDAEAVLNDAARDRGINRWDESSYDSGEFPKVIFADGVGRGDYCCSCFASIGREPHDPPEPEVIREGSSLRTADELAHQYAADAMALGAELSPWGADVFARAGDALDGSLENRWLSDPDLAGELADLAWQVESDLGTLGYVTYWDDGYTIRPVCPVCDDEDHDDY